MKTRSAGRSVGLGVAWAMLTLVLLAKPSRGQERKGPPASGTQQGVRVHGHWIIEIRNPDGSQVSRREFENAFVGAGAIIPLLDPTSNAVKPAGWDITLADATGINLDLVTGGLTCGSLNNHSAGLLFQSLLPTTQGFTLTGSSAGAPWPFTVVSVRTGIFSSATCVGGAVFTLANLAPPITIAKGQSAFVTVTVTFQ